MSRLQPELAVLSVEYVILPVSLRTAGHSRRHPQVVRSAGSREDSLKRDQACDCADVVPGVLQVGSASFYF